MADLLHLRKKERIGILFIWLKEKPVCNKLMQTKDACLVSKGNTWKFKVLLKEKKLFFTNSWTSIIKKSEQCVILVFTRTSVIDLRVLLMHISRKHSTVFSLNCSRKNRTVMVLLFNFPFKNKLLMNPKSDCDSSAADLPKAHAQ